MKFFQANYTRNKKHFTVRTEYFRHRETPSFRATWLHYQISACIPPERWKDFRNIAQGVKFAGIFHEKYLHLWHEFFSTLIPICDRMSTNRFPAVAGASGQTNAAGELEKRPNGLAKIVAVVERVIHRSLAAAAIVQKLPGQVLHDASVLFGLIEHANRANRCSFQAIRPRYRKEDERDHR